MFRSAAISVPRCFGIRPDAVLRLSELPAPDLRFKIALEGRQYAANFGSSKTCHRLSRFVHGWRLTGDLQMAVAVLERPIIEKFVAQMGLAPQQQPKSLARKAGQNFAA